MGNQSSIQQVSPTAGSAPYATQGGMMGSSGSSGRGGYAGLPGTGAGYGGDGGGGGGQVAGGGVGGACCLGGPVDEDGRGGAAATCFSVEVGPKAMKYAGEGEGDYIIETQYKYVGSGAGDLKMVAERRSIVRPCLFCFLFLVIIVLVLSQEQATTTTTTTMPIQVTPPPPTPPTTAPLTTVAAIMTTKTLPYDCNAGFESYMTGWSQPKKDWCCEFAGRACPITTTSMPPGECTFWGDPHIKTFDGGKPSFYGDGEFWIVKSDQVSIQGRFLGTKYTDGLAATNKIAVGGPFLKGHTITVGTMEDGSPGATVNGQPVMTGFPSKYEEPPSLFTLTYDAYGQNVDEGGQSADWEKHVVHMDLPLGVRIEVFRWPNYVDLRIRMPLQPSQDGACGNFNGNPADDTTVLIMDRIGARVEDGDLLFGKRIEVQLTEQEQELLKLCPKDKLKQGKAECKENLKNVEEKVHQMSSCILDKCYGANEHLLKMETKMGLR